MRASGAGRHDAAVGDVDVAHLAVHAIGRVVQFSARQLDHHRNGARVQRAASMAASTSAARGSCARSRFFERQRYDVVATDHAARVIDARCADRNEHRRRLGHAQAGRAEHDRRQLRRRDRDVGIEGRDPGEQIALALGEHAADGVAVGIVFRLAVGEAHAQREARLPRCARSGTGSAFVAAERKAGSARRDVQLLDDLGGEQDGEVGLGEAQPWRRPHEHRIVCGLALLSHPVDVGQLHAGNFRRSPSVL